MVVRVEQEKEEEICLSEKERHFIKSLEKIIKTCIKEHKNHLDGGIFIDKFQLSCGFKKYVKPNYISMDMLIHVRQQMRDLEIDIEIIEDGIILRSFEK
jgi:hypothetical protein